MESHTLQQLKRYSFDELKELFETTMKNVNTFIPIETEDRGRASELAAGSSQVPITDSTEVGSSKRGAEVGLDHEGSKKQKTNEASESVQEQPDGEEKELPQEDLQQMMMVVLVEEVYVKAVQKFDRDDLVKIWDLVKERFSTIEPRDDKEKELWVVLKRLFEPDSDDTLWKLQRYMHDPLVWRLYDTCGVHHVSSVRGHEIFMLIEKDYPFSKGVQMLLLGNKLWFNSEKLVDLDDNHKFRGGLLGFKGWKGSLKVEDGEYQIGEQKKESFMKLQFLTHHSKMVWLKEKIELLTEHGLIPKYYLKLGFSESSREKPMLPACYYDRVPNKRNKTISYELWYKKRPNLSYLRVWGCRAVVRLPDPKRKTLGEKGIDCIVVGYAEHSKAYRFYVIEPNNSVSINSIIESRDAIFDENRFFSIHRPKDVIPNSVESQRMIILMMYQVRFMNFVKEDPRTYDEAMQSRDAAFWKESIDDEIGSIMENNTWVLSDLPPGCKPLGCKWIFKRKMKVDETIDKFKARLVIQGFRQKEGINYFDTYAPAARITTIRLLLALAAINNLVIHQMDVKTSFLNGDLDEEVYMRQPEGFIMPGNEHKVCKLVKSVYGLKQAPKQWHQKFDEAVTDQNQVDKTKKFLLSRFSMKDMGEADVILGIKIKHENKWIVITQSHYIEKILKKFNREDCSPVSTPMDLVEKLKLNTGKPVDHLEYSRAIGCLMYAMTSTRPDIAYAVGRLSRFTSNPMLEGYSNASWINHVEDSSSTSGWVFLLRGGAISWASKKQTCITSSTMESEFVALAAAGKEAKWLRNLIHEISIWPKPIAPISIRYDSAPKIAKAYSQVFNGKSRHLGVRLGMIRELIMNG
ncbi:zinc finger, CCHC-type containing protein [Tanacetum coccineum]